MTRQLNNKKKRKLNRVLVLYASCHLDYNLWNQLQLIETVAISSENCNPCS